MWKRPSWAVFLGGAVVLATAAAVASCSSSQSAVGLASNCSINSDCNSPLICAFGKCHNACKDSARDCPMGERCVTDGVDGVCQLPQELSCAGTGMCASKALSCASDKQCRTPCITAQQCFENQTCVAGTAPGGTGTCFDNSEIDGGVGHDGGGMTDSPPGDDGGGLEPPDGTGGGDAPIDTGNGNSCPVAQTQFGFVAQGDANPNFTSGVGLRTATQLLIFSGYSGPPLTGGSDGGDAGTVNEVFVQAFDLMTAKSLGPAAPLFQAPDGSGFTLADASIDPAGHVALAFNYGAFDGAGSGSNGSAIYATFLAPGADAGAAGLVVGQTVQLESAAQTYQQTHVIWSVASQAFVFSWEYHTAQWFLKLAKYLPDGRGAGGNADVVPTNQPGGLINGSAVVQGSAGTSGNLTAVAYLGFGLQYPWVSFLDQQGNQAASPIELKNMGAGSQWVSTAGTTQGFVAFYDNQDTNGVSAEFIATTGDGGVSEPPDGGDAGLPGFSFPGAMRATDVRGVSDDTGGQGGIGAALLFANGVSFAYVNADGMTHVGPNSVISHAYAAGDFAAISNYRGSFAVSLYSSKDHSTQVAASGCQ